MVKWLVAVGVFLFACKGGGSAVSDATSSTNDAASDGVNDAAIDAMIDAMIDAPADAPNGSLVTVTVHTRTGDGAPDPTATVFFTDSNGAILGTSPVDANGQARVAAPAGSDLTVAQLQSDPNNLYLRHELFTTIRGVQPGDQLVAGRSKDPNYKAGAPDYMTALWTPLQSSASVSTILACAVGGPNGTSTGPIAVTFYASCETPTFDILLMQPTTMGVGEYVWVTGEQHVANGTFTIPDAWAPTALTSTTIVNTGNKFLSGLRLSQVIDAIPVLMDQQSMNVTTAALRYVPIDVPTQLEALVNTGPYSTSDLFVTVTTGSPATTSIDMDMRPLPAVSQVIQNANSVSWTETAAGTPDARIVTWAVQWTDGNLIEHDAVWAILEPATGTTTPLFALPSGLAADDPTLVATTPRGSSVTYVDDDGIAGYDATRAIGINFADVEGQRLSVAHSAHATVTPSFTPP